MKVIEILKVINGRLVKGDKQSNIGKFCRDTRVIEKGETYIGIKGETFDGNQLWKEAIENGATTLILQGINFENEDLSQFENVNIVIVENTIQAIANISKYKRDLYGEELQLVGITGSVGKTSTKDIVANVVSQKYKTLKTEGNKNNEIGLPFTIFNLEDHEAAVIEMGMNHLGEISRLSKIAQPKISVITNVGTSHIGNLGSRENILKAKLEILDGMKNKILVINNDNDLLHDFYLNNKDLEIHTYGIENQSEIMAKEIVLNENNSEFICEINGERIKVTVPVGGIHFVYNALCAITVGKLFGLNSKQIVEGIEKFELTKKRMDISELKNGVKIINDSYNASFESMQASLKYLNNLNSTRKIAVLGDMFELGEFSRELHEKVGEEVVKNKIDILICTGENSRYIIDSAKKNGMDSDKIYYFEDKLKIEKFINNNSKNGDVILFKASNGMKFFEIVDKLFNY